MPRRLLGLLRKMMGMQRIGKGLVGGAREKTDLALGKEVTILTPSPFLHQNPIPAIFSQRSDGCLTSIYYNLKMRIERCQPRA